MNRPLTLGLAALAALLCLSQPASVHAQTGSGAAVGSGHYTGLVINSERLTSGEVRMLQRLNVPEVRIPVVEERMQSKSDWDKLRAHVKSLRAKGIGVVPLLEIQNPGTDDAAERYISHVQTAMMRLGDLIDAVILTNRTNWRSGFDKKFLIKAVKGAKQVRDAIAPEVKLILGGILERDEVWLREYGDTSVLNRVDGIGFDLFPPANGVASTADSDVSKPDDIGGFAKLIERYHQRGLEVWLTELGKNTGPPGVGADEATQTSVLARGLLLAKSVGFDRAFVFSGWDTTSNPNKTMENMGLIDFRGRPKMSFQYLRELIPRLERMEAFSPPREVQIDFSPDFPASNSSVWWVFLREGENIYLYYWNDMTGMTDLTTNLLISGWGIEPVSGRNGYYMREADLNHSSNDRHTVLSGLPISNIPSRVHLRLNSVSKLTRDNSATSAG